MTGRGLPSTVNRVKARRWGGRLAGALALVIAVWAPLAEARQPRRPATAKATAKATPPANTPLWERVLWKRQLRARRQAQKGAKAFATRKYTVAAKHFRAALVIRPDSPALWFDLGTALLWGKKHQAGVKALGQARRLDPTFRTGLLAFRLGLCLTLGGDWAAGVVEYQRVGARTGGVTAGLLQENLGDTLMALGRLREAIGAYRAAIRARPGRKILHFALAVALDRAGRRRSADRQLRHALRLDPKATALDGSTLIWLPRHDHFYYRALAAWGTGQRLAALTNWQRFIRQAPTSPWRYNIERRLDQLRRAPVKSREIRVTKGEIKTDALAQALSKAAPALRLCLGPAASPRPRAEDVRGTRLVLTVSRRGLTGLVVAGLSTALRAGHQACLKRQLTRLRWAALVKATAPATFEWSLIGP